MNALTVMMIFPLTWIILLLEQAYWMVISLCHVKTNKVVTGSLLAVTWAM